MVKLINYFKNLIVTQACDNSNFIFCIGIGLCSEILQIVNMNKGFIKQFSKNK